MNATCLSPVGARFDDRVTGKLTAFAPQAKIVHIDIDPAEIGKNVQPLIPIVGDARNVLARLIEEVKALEPGRERTAAWLAKCAEWEHRFAFGYEHEPGTLAPQFVIEEIDRVTESDALVVTDVGQHQMWATQYYHYQWPRQFISSGRPRHHGLRAAGRHRRQDRPAGQDRHRHQRRRRLPDDHAGAHHRRLRDVPVVVAILNNGYLGMVRQWQDLFWNKRYAHTCIATQPDFAKLADAFGAWA